MRWVVAACAALCATQAMASDARTLDVFEDPARWKVIESDQVTGTLRTIDGPDGKALCLDYDFHGVSGYVGLQRDLALDYPDNYAFAFQLRGEGPRNDFQFKLVDTSGDNVWWATKPKFELPEDWTAMRFRKRHIAKAWGPSEDAVLRGSAKVEFTLASGEGGKGSACFDTLAFAELPPQDDSPLTGRLAHQGDAYVFDLGRPREIGGAILRWKQAAVATDYSIALSGDGRTWRSLREVRGDGGEDYVALPEEETRYLRVQPIGTVARTLEEVSVQPLAFSATPNDFMKAVAARAARGDYPRGFVGEQPYWTIVGVDGGKEQGLLGEDGAVEVAKGGFSIEPFVVSAGKLLAWADVRATQSLLDGYLPIPSVRWTHADFQLDITAFAAGTPDRPQLIARYVLTNTGDAPRDFVFALAARPFQVNPPSQFLNTTGGVSAIREIAAREGTFVVDGRVVQVSQQSTAGIAATFDDGGIVEHLRRLAWSKACFGCSDTTGTPFRAVGTERDEVSDPTGLASAALLYAVRLQPGETREFDWRTPLAGSAASPPGPPAPVAGLQQQMAVAWHGKLDEVKFRVPEDGRHLVDTLRTALAHMAISRVGPRLQPGTRSYSRAWIRDGAMIAEGLLRLGRGDIAKEFLRWYAPYQFDSGKVPCCVDDRGADPVPENDSHGEFVSLVAELYRYTHDRALLEAMWPHVQGAVKYMDALRASERTEANRARNPAFYGLMPASISHEGYSAKPMHSYWDDFWALRGYKDAVEIARWLGHEEETKRFAASRDQFRDDLYASLRTAMTQRKIDFIPGSAELGDFDATSTTIALAPGGEQAALPRDALLATFGRYWREFGQRRDGTREWKDYTPYELRTIGTFVRLGWRDRAHAALDFFFADQQPRAWNQWAEVVSRTPRKPFFLGDLPHAWVASDYVRSALDLFAYTREADDALVVAAGIPGRWLAGEGIAVDGLRTPGGSLSYSIRADAQAVRLEFGKGFAAPAGGLVFAWPFDGAPGRTTIDGEPVRWQDGELRIPQAGSIVVIAR